MYLCGHNRKLNIKMFTTLVYFCFFSFSTYAASDHDVEILSADIAAMTEFTVDSKSDGIVMSLAVDGEAISFDLVENKKLVSELQSFSGNAEFNLYRGKISGVENSWARFTNNNGKMSGAYFDGANLFFVSQPETVENEIVHSLPQYRPADSLVVYNANDVKHSGVCALEGHASNSEFNYQEYTAQLNDMTSAAASSVLQVALHADLAFAGGTSASDQDDAVLEMLTEMNIVDGIFSGQLGLEISVISTDVFDDHSAIPESMTDAEDMVYQYRTFVRNETTNPGISHLFTGKDLNGGTIGIAFVGAVCGSSAVGLTQRYNTRTALVAAHEIGHNMGAPHDGDSRFACGSASNTFLMNPSINGSNQFSDCSLSVMTPFLNRSCILDNEIAPTIDSTANLIGEANQAYNYDADNTVSASGTGPISFALLNGPTGMTVSEEGLVTWTPTLQQVGLNFIEISASNAVGSGTQTFEVMVSPPPLPYINFNDYTVTAYGGTKQDRSGFVGVQQSGLALRLEGNRWQKIEFPYEITPNTVIEFDFESENMGEIHGIGFNDDEAIQSNTLFNVSGTQSWGINTQSYTANGIQRFTIPVGEFYTGAVNYLYFVMDNDVPDPLSDSTFSNILIYEREVIEVEPLNFNDLEITLFKDNQNIVGFHEVLDEGATLRLEGNIWRKVGFNHVIEADTVLEFEFKSNSQGEIHGIGFNTNGSLTSGKTFQLFGTQNYANRDFTYTGNGEFETFSIPIGQFYIGPIEWLRFIMDNDVDNPDSESVFKNIVIK